MKKLLVVLMFIDLLIGCAILNKRRVPDNLKNQYLGVMLNENWNNDSIQYYKTYFNDFNIDFDVVDLEYATDGKLHSAKIIVNCRDGYSGSADISGKYLSRLGFIRDYRKDSEIQFMVGILR